MFDNMPFYKSTDWLHNPSITEQTGSVLWDGFMGAEGNTVAIERRGRILYNVLCLNKTIAVSFKRRTLYFAFVSSPKSLHDD